MNCDKVIWYQTSSRIFRVNKREKMSQERDQQNLSSGEEFHELDETGNETHELGMMVTITNQTGEPLPTGYLIVTNILGLLLERTGVQPCEVSIMNDRDVLVEFEQGAPILDISRQLIGPGMWGELHVEIGCVISGRVSLVSMCHEKSKQIRQGEEFKNQVQNLQRDQGRYQTQLTEVVQVLQDRLKVIEQNSQENVDPFHTPS